MLRLLAAQSRVKKSLVGLTKGRVQQNAQLCGSAQHEKIAYGDVVVQAKPICD